MIAGLRAVLEAVPKPLIRPLPEPLWIVAGGDLMLGRGASDILLREGPPGIFGATAEMIASADLALVNLEGVLSRRGEKVKKSFNFRFAPEAAPALREAGIDAVLHANNHVYDYGEDAFLDSLSWLEQAGIGVAGAGLDDDAAAAPFVWTRAPAVVRVFGIASFPREGNGWDGVSAAAGPGRPGRLHARRGGVEKLKTHLAAKGAGTAPPLDVILFHGGHEWSTAPDRSTRELYTGLVAAGADLVIGSHPHVVQGFEWVRGKPVFWSLGNYVFGGMDNTPGGEEGLFIRLGYWENRLLYLEPFALRLSHTRTDISPPEKLETFYRLSRELQAARP
jgi:poly-gamma-glutamate synthesis protein (capsule biosynthesis protein)